MYHSLIFIEKKYWDNFLEDDMDGDQIVLSRKEKLMNTWDEWKIVPSSRPVFNPPKQKTQYLDIPGADGSLDVSEALTGYSVFENREGSIEFYVTNDYKKYRWQVVYENISNFLHGQQMRCILEDDPGYFYEGRFQVDSWASEKDYSKITINYNVKPYKYELTRSIDNWLWDPFNFETGYISAKLYNQMVIATTTAAPSNVADYSKTTTYSIGDFVKYNRNVFVAKKESTGNAPPNSEFWSLVLLNMNYTDSGLMPFCPEFKTKLPTATEAYSESKAYSVGDLVLYNNKTYVAKQAGTGKVPTNTDYWTTPQITVTYQNGTNNQTLTRTIKKSGTTIDPEMMVFGGDVTFTFSGTGTISIIFRRGRL